MGARIKEMIKEINRGLEINPDRFDIEIMRQPPKFCYWGIQSVKATKRLARGKKLLKELVAKLSKDYRIYMRKTSPNTNVTKPMIEEFVFLHEDYKDLADQVIQATYEADLLEVAKNSFFQRYKMLEEMGRERRNELYQTDFAIYKKEIEGRMQEQKR